MNEQLEQYLRGLANGRPKPHLTSYDEARRRARALGYEYVENEQLLTLSPEKRLERLETLVVKGVANDTGARAALLGTEKRPVFRLSKLFEEYEAAIKDEVKDLSPNQLRIWRNERMRAVENFVEVVGNKLVTEVSHDDGIDYTEWWRDRVTADEVDPKTANKDIGQLSRIRDSLRLTPGLSQQEVIDTLTLVAPLANFAVQALRNGP